MPDETVPNKSILTDEERAYLKALIHQRYSQINAHQHGHNKSHYKKDLKHNFAVANKSNEKKDFRRGAIAGGLVGGYGGGLLGALGGLALTKHHHGPGRVIGGGLLGLGVGAAAGGYLGGKGGARQGNMVRGFSKKPLPETYREGDDILDKDKTTIDRNKTLNRASSVAGIAGLASTPIQLALGSSLPLMGQHLDQMDDKTLVELLQHSGFDDPKKKMMFGHMEHGNVKPGFPKKDKDWFWRENAFYSDKPETDKKGNPIHGVIGATSKRMMRPGIIAHELGHANINKNKGVVGFMQKHLYQHVSPGSGVGQYYGVLPTALTGIATKDDDNVGTGVAKGTAIAGAAYSPLLAPEFEASRRGIKALMKTNLPMKSRLLNSALLVPAFGTYALAALGPSAAVGGYNAWLNKKHKGKGAKKSSTTT